MATRPAQLFALHAGRAGAFAAGLALFFCGLMVCMPVMAARTAQADDKPAILLPTAVPIEREIAGAQTHVYTVTASADHFLHVEVEQRGVDVVLTWLAADGQPLIACDHAGGLRGVESAAIVAPVAGDYRLQIRAVLPKAAAGRYGIKLTAPRMANERDRALAAAQVAFAEGVQLQSKADGESKRQAVAQYEAALALYRSLDDCTGERAALFRLGSAYTDLDAFTQALDAYNHVLPMYQAAGDGDGAAMTLAGIGWVYNQSGEKQRALPYLNQALAAFNASGNRRDAARVFDNLGHVYNEIGETRKAVECYLQSLALNQAVGDEEAEAYTLTGIGEAYDNLGERQQALAYFSRALALHRASGNRRSEANTLTDMGWIYKLLGEKRKALDYFTQALRLCQQTGYEGGEAYALLAVSGVYLVMGESAKALDYAEQALVMHRHMKDYRAEAYSLHTLGWTHQTLGNLAKALDYYNQALPLHRRANDPKGEAFTLTTMGQVYESLGERERALAQLEPALLLHHRVGLLHGEINVLYRLAHLERERGNLAAARTRIEEAINLTESARAKIGSHDLRAAYLASVQQCYEFYIDLLYQLHESDPRAGHMATALQVSERARARGLLELLIEARADIRRDVDRALLDEESRLQQRLTAASDARIRLLNGKHTDEQVTAAETELEQLSGEYERLQAKIRMADPRYAALIHRQAPMLAEVQQLLDGETVLLEYALGQSRSFLWMVTPNSLDWFVLPPRDMIETAARQALARLTARTLKVAGETLAQRTARIRKADAQYDAAATELSRLLLSPVAAQLGKRRLLIVSDGALQYLSFAALTEDGQPLMLAHEIIHLPSAATLVQLRRDREGRRAPNKTITIFADPVFEATDLRVSRAPTLSAAKAEARARPQADTDARADREAIRDYLLSTRAVAEGAPLARLPYSRREALAIAAQVAATERRVHLDFNVNHQTATSAELSDYRFIHFATHGLLDSEHPELSGILLSLVDATGRPQRSGILRLGEIYNLKLRADLVTLSACETALGKSVRGEGLIGLTRGFMYAGAPRVLSSLWKVEEAATAELMTRFYTRVLGPARLRPAEALRQAQIEMWHESHHRAPYFWAGFILQGEWR
jgi:CHAT domain-containing protein